jgi:hypothetical protein
MKALQYFNKYGGDCRHKSELGLSNAEFFALAQSYQASFMGMTNDDFMKLMYAEVGFKNTELMRAKGFAIASGMATTPQGPVIFGNDGYTSGGLNFTDTTAKHMNDSNRAVPVQTLNDAISYSKAYPDPQGTSAKMYYSTMYRNGNLYNLEVLYDSTTNTIMHFEYTPKAIGPLPAISK